MRWLLPPSDRYRREWWWLTLVLIATGLVLALWLWAERNSLEQRESQRLAQQTEMLHDTLLLQMRGIDKALSSLLATWVEDAQQPPEVRQQRLNALGETVVGVRALSVLDAQGRITFSSRSELIGRECQSWAYFQESLRLEQRQMLLLSPPFELDNGQAVMVLARPLPSADGSFQGVMSAHLNPDDFRALLRSALYTTDARSALLHASGRRFVVQAGQSLPVQKELLSTNLLLGEFLREGQSAGVGLGRVHPDDALRLVSLRLLQPRNLAMDVPLVVAVSREWEALLAPWQNKLWWAVALYLVLAMTASVGLRAMQRNLHHVQSQEEALQAKDRALDARWQAVLTATGQGVWDYDLVADKVYYSPVWKQMLGYAEEDVGDGMQEWVSRVHPDDWPQVQARWALVQDGKMQEYTSVHRMRCKDGSWCWTLDRGRVIAQDAQGLPLRVVGTKSDVSQEHRQRQRFEHLSQNVPGMIYQFQKNPDGHAFFPYFSQGMQEVYGVSPEAMYQGVQAVIDIIHPDDFPQVMASTALSGQTLGLWECEFRVNHPRSGERWLKGQARPQRLDDGAVLWHGYVHDITDAKRQAIQFDAARRVQQHLMATMPVALCLVDAKRQIYYRNQRFLEYFGYTAEEVPSMAEWAVRAYPEEEYRSKVSQLWRQALQAAYDSAEGYIDEQEYRVTSYDGTLLTVAIRGMRFEDKWLITFHDRTAQQAQAEQWQRWAYLDGLTGLANRRQFDRSLLAEWQRCYRAGKPLALVMLDIDFFKQYNDYYGHPKGDSCMQAVAGAIRPFAERSYDLMARYGGEEFACLLPECTLEGARTKALAMCQAVRDLQWEHNGSMAAPIVTISAGVATLVPDAQLSGEDLLARADTCLYSAKRAGRNGVHDGQQFYTVGSSVPIE